MQYCYVLYDSEICDKVRKLLQVFADKPSVKTNKVELRDDDLHNIATDLVLSEQRGVHHYHNGSRIDLHRKRCT